MYRKIAENRMKNCRFGSECVLMLFSQTCRDCICKTMWKGHFSEQWTIGELQHLDDKCRYKIEEFVDHRAVEDEWTRLKFLFWHKTTIQCMEPKTKKLALENATQSFDKSNQRIVMDFFGCFFFSTCSNSVEQNLLASEKFIYRVFW